MIDQLFTGNSYDAVKRALDFSLQRQEAIAGNIANVETPGYKRMDLDKTQYASFQRELQSATQSGDFSRLDNSGAAGGLSAGAMPKLSADPEAKSLRQDGNNVEIDNEMLAMSRNTVEYNVLTDFASSSLKQLKMAITGREG